MTWCRRSIGVGVRWPNKTQRQSRRTVRVHTYPAEAPNPTRAFMRCRVIYLPSAVRWKISSVLPPALACSMRSRGADGRVGCSRTRFDRSVDRPAPRPVRHPEARSRQSPVRFRRSFPVETTMPVPERPHPASARAKPDAIARTAFQTRHGSE